MAKRRSISREKCFAVQGEGSWVKIRKLSFGQVAKIQNMDEDEMSKEAETEMLMELVKTQVVEWNWVDDDGEPMSIPSELEDFNAMTAEEFNFLLNIILDGIGEVETKKRANKEKN